MSLYKLTNDFTVVYSGGHPNQFQREAIEICNKRRAYKIGGRPITDEGIKKKLKDDYCEQTIEYVIEIKDTLNSNIRKMKLPDDKDDEPQFHESSKISKPRKLLKSRYDSENKINDNIKEEINRQFAKKLKLMICKNNEAYNNQTTVMMYLDSRTMRTTKYLMEIGIKRKNCMCRIVPMIFMK